jgi:hypothetical protein
MKFITRILNVSLVAALLLTCSNSDARHEPKHLTQPLAQAYKLHKMQNGCLKKKLPKVALAALSAIGLSLAYDLIVDKVRVKDLYEQGSSSAITVASLFTFIAASCVISVRHHTTQCPPRLLATLDNEYQTIQYALTLGETISDEMASEAHLLALVMREVTAMPQISPEQIDRLNTKIENLSNIEDFKKRLINGEETDTSTGLITKANHLPTELVGPSSLVNIPISNQPVTPKEIDAMTFGKPEQIRRYTQYGLTAFALALVIHNIYKNHQPLRYDQSAQRAPHLLGFPAIYALGSWLANRSEQSEVSVVYARLLNQISNAEEQLTQDALTKEQAHNLAALCAEFARHELTPNDDATHLESYASKFEEIAAALSGNREESVEQTSDSTEIAVENAEITTDLEEPRKSESETE